MLFTATVAAPGAPLVASLSGERWRLDIHAERGTFDFLVQPKGETGYVSVMRAQGEAAWYGYNEPAGERRTCDVKPAAFSRQGNSGPVTVRCVLDRENGVTHEAVYYPLSDGVLVVSRFSAKTLPREASIIRAAPKLDVNISLLTDYAFAGSDERTHTGAIAELGARATYAGGGAWGPGGDQTPALGGDYPYMLLFDPQKAVSLGIVFPFYQAAWRNVRSFLQLWTGDCNFWYTGWLPPDALRGERIFVLYTRQSDSPEAIRADAERLCREATDRIARGTIEAPTVRAMLGARQQFDHEWPALWQQAAAAQPTRPVWVALLMLRSAKECVEREPVTARQLLDRAKQALGEEGS